MKIILHADDFGFDEDTCQATIELFERGILKSASIMANMPASNKAIKYAVEHPEFSFGVHLTYVDGLKPLCKHERIRTLTDENGLFLPSDTLRKKALLLKVGKEEIIAESIKQITLLQDVGVAVSHLDSHGHLHKFPSFLYALNHVSSITGIHKVRRVQNVHIHYKSYGLTSGLNLIFNRYISSHFETTDMFYMPANNMDIRWSEKLLKEISFLSSEGTMEVGVHPGTQERWRREEMHDIEEFANRVISDNKHQLINWNDL